MSVKIPHSENSQRGKAISSLPKEKINRRRFISFAAFIGLYGSAWAAWRWLYKQPGDGGLLGGIQIPLRSVLNANERIFTSGYHQDKLAPSFERKDAAVNPRVNNDIGLDADFDPKDWKLAVQKKDGSTLSVTLDQIRAMPKTEVIFDFKCIEGWSQVSYWGGVRFIDFARHFRLDKEIAMKYAGASTPDDGYYVGLDMESLLHPQTILCYEMNAKPLTPEHGYPLRLISPVKYGIKNIKRIGNFYFNEERPADYWAERGYDYYAGL